MTRRHFNEGPTLAQSAEDAMKRTHATKRHLTQAPAKEQETVRRMRRGVEVAHKSPRVTMIKPCPKANTSVLFPTNGAKTESFGGMKTVDAPVPRVLRIAAKGARTAAAEPRVDVIAPPPPPSRPATKAFTLHTDPFDFGRQSLVPAVKQRRHLTQDSKGESERKMCIRTVAAVERSAKPDHTRRHVPPPPSLLKFAYSASNLATYSPPRPTKRVDNRNGVPGLSLADRLPVEAPRGRKTNAVVKKRDFASLSGVWAALPGPAPRPVAATPYAIGTPRVNGNRPRLSKRIVKAIAAH